MAVIDSDIALKGNWSFHGGNRSTTNATIDYSNRIFNVNTKSHLTDEPKAKILKNKGRTDDDEDYIWCIRGFI